MRSIFDHKQYDLICDDGSPVFQTVTRELYGLSWNIYPIDYNDMVCAIRDIDLAILLEEMDFTGYTINHTFELDIVRKVMGIKCTFGKVVRMEYTNRCLTVYSKDNKRNSVFRDYIKITDIEDISLEEVVDYIKVMKEKKVLKI